MVGVMLVEDHALIRQALAILLEGEPGLRVVAQAGSVAEAHEQAEGLKGLIDVAVLDFVLPDGDAVDLIGALRLTSPAAKILVFTASVDPETSRRAFEAGADSTLHKTASKVEILAAVRSLLEG